MALQPPAGKWMDDDWQSDLLCPTPGFNVYRDALIMNPSPTTHLVDMGQTLESICFHRCGIEDSTEHSAQKNVTFTSGWSIGGNASASTASLWKAFQLQVGISGSYTESKSITDIARYTFGHSEKTNFVRWWTANVLQVRRVYSGRVIRHYQTATGTLSAVTNYQGSVEFTQHSMVVGKPTFNDVRCKDWREPGAQTGETTGSVSLAPGTEPGTITDILKYDSRSQEDAIRHLASRIRLRKAEQVLLKAVLKGDQSAIAAAEHKLGDQQASEDSIDARRGWILMNKDVLQHLTERERKLVEKHFLK